MKSNLPGVDNDKVKESEPLRRKENSSGEPTIPVHVPMSLFRWLLYSLFFSGITNAFLAEPFGITIWQWVALSLILGHFAGQINSVINKK